MRGRLAGRRFLAFGIGPEWSGCHALLALLAMGGVALYLVALRFASGGLAPVWWLLVIVPLLTWSLTDSAAALILWGWLILMWVNTTPAGSHSWWSLLAATGAAISHAATALADSGPPTWAIPARLARRWLRWVGVGMAAAALVAALDALLAGRVDAASPAAYVIGLVGLAGAVWLLRTNPPGPGG